MAGRCTPVRGEAVGFSVRIAPGVRVRASSRGVRTSIGPRAARVHVGGGRTGFSTGVGPLTYYTSAGSSRRPSSRTGTATANRQLASAARAADKVEQARVLADALDAVLNVHREEFADASRPVAPPPPPVDTAAILARHKREAKSSTSVFARSARKAALAQAQQSAAAEITHAHAQAEAQRAALQASLDHEWADLNAGDPDTVLGALAAAFEDNEAAAAAVGMDAGEVTLLVVVPSANTLPDRHPTTTAAGNLSLKKWTKRELADLYKLLVCGHALVTVKEAFAVIPFLDSARVVALRSTPPDAYGNVRPEAVLAARFERDRLQGIQWSEADAVRVVNDASSECIFLQRGATAELIPIDMSTELELAQLLESVDFEELL